MKQNFKNLIKKANLIGHLPHGGIEKIAADLQKDRGTVRGALKGDWVNTQITDHGLKLIEDQIDHLKSFTETFKPEYEKTKNAFLNGK